MSDLKVGDRRVWGSGEISTILFITDQSVLYTNSGNEYVCSPEFFKRNTKPHIEEVELVYHYYGDDCIVISSEGSKICKYRDQDSDFTRIHVKK